MSSIDPATTVQQAVKAKNDKITRITGDINAEDADKLESELTKIIVKISSSY